MTRIVLTNIYLVNWYGFINTKIPVGKNMTLITGENECGKSTILDAVKYAFTGDSEFNKSSGVHNAGGGRRTLHSYTRCLINPSAGIFARPADKMPNVYSHISLEYYDELNSDRFVLGVILETNASNNVNTYWYAMEHTAMDSVEYVYEDKGGVKPYDYQRFQKKYGVQIMSRKEALTKFMTMTGLKLAYSEIGKFQRKLRNIMTYNPAAKIQQFIKESVLEAHDVNFDKLRDAKNNIEKINGTLEFIQAEVNALEGILKDFSEYEKISVRLLVDDVKRIYKEILRFKEAISEAEQTMERNHAQIQHLTEVIGRLSGEKGQMESDYLKAKGNLNELDCSRAIEEERENLRRLTSDQERLEQERKALHDFQGQVDEMLRLMQTLNAAMDDMPVLRELTSKEHSYAEKKSAADSLKKRLDEEKETISEQGYEIKKRLNEVQKELDHYHRVIEDCGKNKADYSGVQEQAALIREINREFRSRNIPSKAMFSCEYVIRIKDEEWREAIEAFLGIHRYSIIVEPKYFDIANEVLDRSAHKYVELVNTKLLAAREVKHLEGSAAEKLVIKNDIARKYFDYWLGGIRAVPMGEVSRYESAMSKEGKLSRSMSVTYIDTRKVRTFCLGQEAIELNRKAAERRIEELTRQEKEILTARAENDGFCRQIKGMLNCFGDYNFDADLEYDALVRKINESEEKLRELLAAQENNLEYQTLFNRVQELEEGLAKLGKNLEDSKDGRRKLELDNENQQRALAKSRLELRRSEDKLEEQRLLHAGEVRTAMQEYDDFLSGASKTGDLMIPGSRERTDRKKRELENSIIGGQKLYNNKKKPGEQLPEGLECEGRYLARRNKIWVDDLQGIQAKLEEQTRKYESIFKNEFVLSLYQTALSAQEDIRGINKELRKLQFATKYQFDVSLLDDKSDYAKILRYAEYLKKTNKVDDGQLVFGSLYGYEDDEIEQREREIKEIINRIIDKNDVGVIQSFADYRNYMSYEIIINNADVKDGKLSKQAGYNSGAGTQIPYTLILSAALSMLYNARVNVVRLIFIDEPFEKMSDHNIKLMLEFFKNQNFQVIFCAPPNKTDSIGYECDTVIPVLKISNDNMQTGSVQFHDHDEK